MTTHPLTDPARTPAGTPTGGQFAARTHAETDGVQLMLPFPGMPTAPEMSEMTGLRFDELDADARERACLDWIHSPDAYDGVDDMACEHVLTRFASYGLARKVELFIDLSQTHPDAGVGFHGSFTPGDLTVNDEPGAPSIPDYTACARVEPTEPRIRLIGSAAYPVHPIVDWAPAHTGDPARAQARARYEAALADFLEQASTWLADEGYQRLTDLEGAEYAEEYLALAPRRYAADGTLLDN